MYTLGKNKRYKRFTLWKMLGTPNELEVMIEGENGTRIRNCVPEKCSSCCSIYDNQIMDLIRAELSILNDLDDVEFMLTY